MCGRLILAMLFSAIAGSAGALATSAAVFAAATLTVTFDAMAIGEPPSGFTTALTGGGGPVMWRIVADPTAASGDRILAQLSADPTDYRFPICLRDSPLLRDVDVSVRFKAISGRVDRAAGLIVRARDADTYYVVRANALEDNVRLYRVVAGKRVQIAGADVKVPSGRWQVLRLKAEGSELTVFFNGAQLFKASDRTLSAEGRVGLWTKADSVVYFDNLVIIAGGE